MDEIWQRHKTFILQCVIGGLVFLIAWIIMGNTYDGTELLQASNRTLKADLLKRVNERNDKTAPSPDSIKEQKATADEAQKQIRKMAGEVASLKTDEDYVRQNIVWILKTIEKPEADAERYLALYRSLPVTCLTSVREEARAVLVGRAAQKGRSIDETFGLTVGVQDAEVPGALHALAIVCDVVRRTLDRDRIQSVADVRVQAANVLDRDLPWISGVEVRLNIVGDPADVMSVVRSFNELDPVQGRMTVMREVETIARRSADDDSVKASLVLLGLQYKDQQTAQGAPR